MLGMSDHDVPTLCPLADAPDELDLLRSSGSSHLYLLADAGGTAYASLAWGTPSRGKSVGSAAGGRWTFGQPGGLAHKHLDVTDADGNDVVRVVLHQMRNTAEFELDGVPYALEREGVVHLKQFVTRGGTRLLEVDRAGTGIKEKQASVTLSAAGRVDPHLDLVLLLLLDRVVAEMVMVR